MSFLNNIFKSSKKEIDSLKQDVKDLTELSSQLQMIDSRAFEISKFNNSESFNFDDNVLIVLWKQVPEISTVISKITDRAKSVPWGHFKVKDKAKVPKFKTASSEFLSGHCSLSEVIYYRDVAYEQIFDYSVEKLLKNPNQFQSWGEMIEQLLSYWYVTGNSFLIKIGAFAHVPYSLQVMASQQTDVKIKDSFLKDPFQVNNKEQPIDYYSFDNGYGKTLTYEEDLILHMKAPTLIYGDGAWVKGYSPLASAILASRTLKQEYISRLSLVRDRGSMGMVVADGKANETPSSEDTKALYERLKKFGLGDGKSNSYAVTNAALRWMQMSFNSSELELLDGRTENLKVLARKFNVPTDLLIGDSTFNNVNTAGRIIYTSNVIPWLDSFKSKFNKLIGLNQEKEVVMPMYDSIAELQQDLSIQTDIITKQYDSNLITKDEAREGLNRPISPNSGKYKTEKDGKE